MRPIDVFFSRNFGEEPFILFSLPHLGAIWAIACLCILMYMFRARLKGEKAGRVFRLVLAVFLILQEISFHLWNISIGEWSLQNTLPLQLCGISTILSSIMLMRRSYSLYEVVYFWGIGGAAQAILTPEIGPYTWPHYRYFQFFLSHGAIVMACLFMTFVEGYRPRMRSLLKAFIWLNVYASFIGILNELLGSNYLFICRKPKISSIMDYLGPWPLYIISLEFIALAVFYILYLPFSGKGDRSQNNKKSWNFQLFY